MMLIMVSTDGDAQLSILDAYDNSMLSILILDVIEDEGILEGGYDGICHVRGDCDTWYTAGNKRCHVVGVMVSREITITSTDKLSNWEVTTDLA